MRKQRLLLLLRRTLQPKSDAPQSLGNEPKALQASECSELLDLKLPKGDPTPTSRSRPQRWYTPEGTDTVAVYISARTALHMHTLLRWVNCRDTVLAGEQIIV